MRHTLLITMFVCSAACGPVLPEEVTASNDTAAVDHEDLGTTVIADHGRGTLHTSATMNGLPASGRASVTCPSAMFSADYDTGGNVEVPATMCSVAFTLRGSYAPRDNPERMTTVAVPNHGRADVAADFAVGHLFVDPQDRQRRPIEAGVVIRSGGGFSALARARDRIILSAGAYTVRVTPAGGAPRDVPVDVLAGRRRQLYVRF